MEETLGEGEERTQPKEEGETLSRGRLMMTWKWIIRVLDLKSKML